MTPAEQAMHDQGVADATAGRKATPPTMGGKIADAYNAGYTSVAPAAKPSPKKSSGAGNGSRSTTARKGSRSNAGARRTYRRAARQIRVPVGNRINGLLPAVGATVALALLYNALTHAQAASGFIGTVGKGLAWLEDPTKSIPYGRGA